VALSIRHKITDLQLVSHQLRDVKVSNLSSTFISQNYKSRRQFSVWSK